MLAQEAVGCTEETVALFDVCGLNKYLNKDVTANSGR